MKTLTPPLILILTLVKVHSLVNRRFDGSLGGLGFTEFIILYHLNSAPEQKLRRIDLAGKVGLTASGITRLLLPMEKVGLVRKETNPNDARVSYVLLASGGKTRFNEALVRAEQLANEIIPPKAQAKVEDLTEVLTSMTGTVL